MRKREKIERAVQTILNRVRFHAPMVLDDEIDKRVLFDGGVDASKPIFVFTGSLSPCLLRAFEIASHKEDFNLVLSTTSLNEISFSKLKNIKNLVVFSSQVCSSRFVEMINKLNINYSSSSNYNLIYKSRFAKVNGRLLETKYDDFSVCHTSVVGDFFVNYKEFVLNGLNLCMKVQNCSNKTSCAVLELNIPLKKGYYLFKKEARAVRVENLMTKEVLYLNFSCKSAEFSFSAVEGLENSTFACVNFKTEITLAASAEGFVFINLGEEKFALKGQKEIMFFERLAKTRCYEVFDVQIKTKNPKFDLFFNKTLPEKIWFNWLNFSPDRLLEEKYLCLKKLFIKGTKELNFVNFREIGVRELGIFNGKYYKKIVVVSGEEKFLRIGRKFFYQTSKIASKNLSSSEPMAICFGK